MNKKDKKLREYMKLPYTITLRRDEEGDFIARVKELEGCVADGQDEMEALGNLELMKALWIETALKAGEVIPQPEQEEDLPSGKFLTRVPRSLHKSLIDIAKQEGVSLNQLVTVSLAEVAGRKAAVPTRPVEIEILYVGHHGVGAYGSTQGVSKLRLVNPDRSNIINVEASGLLMEGTVANVLSMQAAPQQIHTSVRKEA
jgi:antitoxin HicB